MREVAKTKATKTGRTTPKSQSTKGVHTPKTGKQKEEGSTTLDVVLRILPVFITIFAIAFGVAWWLTGEIRKRPTTEEMEKLVAKNIKTELSEFYITLLKEDFAEVHGRLNEIVLKLHPEESEASGLNDALKKKNEEIERLQQENNDLRHENELLKAQQSLARKGKTSL